MIADSVAHCRASGREVFYDAEHFFDGLKANRDYALGTLRAAADAGAQLPGGAGSATAAPTEDELAQGTE